MLMRSTLYKNVVGQVIALVEIQEIAAGQALLSSCSARIRSGAESAKRKNSRFSAFGECSIPEDVRQLRREQRSLQKALELVLKADLVVGYRAGTRRNLRAARRKDGGNFARDGGIAVCLVSEVAGKKFVGAFTGQAPRSPAGCSSAPGTMPAARLHRRWARQRSRQICWIALSRSASRPDQIPCARCRSAAPVCWMESLSSNERPLKVMEKVRKPAAATWRRSAEWSKSPARRSARCPPARQRQAAHAPTCCSKSSSCSEASPMERGTSGRRLPAQDKSVA